MLKSYFVIALRNLVRSKLYTLITILGLSIGYASVILIVLFVSDELSFDRFFERSELIYRLVTESDEGGELKLSASSPVDAIPLLKERLSDDIQAICRMTIGADILIRYKDKVFFEREYLYADDSFFTIFPLPFLAGNPATALSEPYSIVITESIARKYFGAEAPLGKVFTEEDGGQYTVTGVVRDLPKNMHFTFDFLASLITVLPKEKSSLIQYSLWTYFLLKPDADIDAIQARLPSIAREFYEPYIRKQLNTSYDEYIQRGNMRNFLLQPLTDIHLDDTVTAQFRETGNKNYTIILATIGSVLLIMASMIFVNLSITRSAKRAREVGMRKVFGATRFHLVRQFLIESILLSGLALLLALAIAEISLPSFNELSGKFLEISSLHRPDLLLTFLGFSIVIGILAGLYPSFYLSSFQPINALKRQNPRLSYRNRLIDALVIVQLAVSLSALVLMFVVRHQHQYVQQKNLGFSKEQTLIMINSFPFSSVAEQLKERILKLDTVRAASYNNFFPGYHSESLTIRNSDDPHGKLHSVQRLYGDKDFVPLLGIQVLAGDIVPPEPSTKEKKEIAVVINETAATALDLDNPVGSRFTTFYGQTLRVCGVISDFHYESLHKKIRPLVLVTYSPDMFHQISVRVVPEKMKETVEQLKAIWRDFYGERAFTVYFLDKQFEWMYDYEKRTGNLLVVSSLLTIILACLGLFGQIAYRAEQQAKEMAIRKILGASPLNLILQILKTNIPLFLISLLLSWPLSWLLVTTWLHRFAYYIHVDFSLFLIATVVTLGVTILTMGQQAMKSAMRNPIEAIGYE